MPIHDHGRGLPWRDRPDALRSTIPDDRRATGVKAWKRPCGCGWRQPTGGRLYEGDPRHPNHEAWHRCHPPI